MKGKKRVKPIDYIIIVLFLAAAGFSLFYAVQHKEGKARLIVSDGKREWVYPLDTDRDIEARGVLGISRICIQNGQALFLDSPCDNRICVQSFPLSRNGDWAACLPNQIFIHVEGADEADAAFDAVGF